MEPNLTLEDFFAATTLADAQQGINDVLDNLVTGGFNRYLNRRERANMIYFLRQIESLLPTCYDIFRSAKI
jgi:hypothetical protein